MNDPFIILIPPDPWINQDGQRKITFQGYVKKDISILKSSYFYVYIDHNYFEEMQQAAVIELKNDGLHIHIFGIPNVKEQNISGFEALHVKPYTCNYKKTVNVIETTIEKEQQIVIDIFIKHFNAKLCSHEDVDKYRMLL